MSTPRSWKWHGHEVIGKTWRGHGHGHGKIRETLHGHGHEEIHETWRGHGRGHAQSEERGVELDMDTEFFLKIVAWTRTWTRRETGVHLTLLSL